MAKVVLERLALLMNVKNGRCFPETIYLSFRITFAHMAFPFAAFSAFSATFTVSFRATDEIKHSTLSLRKFKKKKTAKTTPFTPKSTFNFRFMARSVTKRSKLYFSGRRTGILGVFSSFLFCVCLNSGAP